MYHGTLQKFKPRMLKTCPQALPGCRGSGLVVGATSQGSSYGVNCHMVDVFTFGQHKVALIDPSLRITYDQRASIATMGHGHTLSGGQQVAVARIVVCWGRYVSHLPKKRKSEGVVSSTIPHQPLFVLSIFCPSKHSWQP